MNHLDDPAMPSRTTVPRSHRHLAVVGHSRMTPRYSVARPAGATSWLMIWTITGRGEIRHDDSSIAADPGDLVVLGPGVRQRYATTGDDWELRWFHFQPRPTWTTVWTPWRAGPVMFRAHVADPRGASRVDGAFARASECPTSTYQS